MEVCGSPAARTLLRGREAALRTRSPKGLAGLWARQRRDAACSAAPAPPRRRRAAHHRTGQLVAVGPNPLLARCGSWPGCGSSPRRGLDALRGVARRGAAAARTWPPAAVGTTWILRDARGLGSPASRRSPSARAVLPCRTPTATCRSPVARARSAAAVAVLCWGVDLLPFPGPASARLVLHAAALQRLRPVPTRRPVLTRPSVQGRPEQVTGVVLAGLGVQLAADLQTRRPDRQEGQACLRVR